MANNRDLFKEAIADAKAVKETAIANAKAALEEAFAPRLTSMLSAKLEEMEDMDEGYDDVDEMKHSKEVEEAKEDMDEGYGKKDMDEEVDLDEILAELEEGDEEKEDVKEADEMDETIDEAEEDEEVEVDAEESEEDEDEEIDLEEMSEDDLKSFIEDVIADMVEAGELEAGEDFEAEDEMDSEEEMDIDVEDDTEEIMEGEEEVNEEKEDMDEGVMDKLKAIYNDPEVLGKLITVDGKKMSLKDFLAMAGGATAGSMAGGGQASSTKTPGSGVAEGEDEDMMEEVNALRAELHEVNLLNAKLLYANKIFRAKTLKEAQKVKVLEAFDKAETVKEVKLVFETLTEEVEETKTVVKENLGRASKAAGVAPKRQIVEVNSQVARWQKLAGIK